MSNHGRWDGEYQVTLTGRRGSAIYEGVKANSAREAANGCAGLFAEDHHSDSISEGTVTRIDGKSDPDGLHAWTI